MKGDELIYHYTDYKGLKGIIESNSLRFTLFSDTNDKSELTYPQKFFYKLINYSLDKLIAQHENEIDKEKEKEILWSSLIQVAVGDVNDREKLLNLDEEFPIAVPFIFSFCEHIDEKEEIRDEIEKNGILSMWRNYSRKSNETGYAIGLNKPDVEEIINYFCKRKTSAAFIFKKVIYTTADFMKTYQKYCKLLEGFPDSFSTGNFGDQVEPTISLLGLYKNPAFHEEKEFRAIVFVPKKNISKNLEIKARGKRKCSNIKIENLDSDKAYIEVTNHLNKLPIKEIILDSNSDSQNKQEIEQLLKDNGYNNVKVRVSEIPYTFFNNRY